jgi:uncharacterized DUF497 family protein
VDFREAGTVSGDEFSETFPDALHSKAERRFLTIGMSARHRVLVVAHTEDGDTIRIVSARPVTRRERRYHEEQERRSN